MKFSIMTLAQIIVIGCVFTVAQARGDTSNIPEDGVNNVWYAQDEDSDSVIVFVHGIMSDSRNAWLYQDDVSGTEVYWPELILNDRTFQENSIFLGGYFSQIRGELYSFRDSANELYTGLSTVTDKSFRAPLDRSRIIFVTHSAGGIVVRQLLLGKERELKDKTIGLLLIASPSGGSNDAQRIEYISEYMGNQQLSELSSDSQYLNQVDLSFRNLINENRIERLVGEEWLEHYLKEIPGICDGCRLIGKYLKRKIVDDQSGGKYFGEPIKIARSDHISIVKPDSVSHLSHMNLKRFYKKRFLLGDPLAKNVQAKTIEKDDTPERHNIASKQGGHVTQIPNIGGEQEPSADGPVLEMGETFVECGNCPLMVPIPGGSYRMGANSLSASGEVSAWRQHTVILPAYAIGKYEVTVKEFLEFAEAEGYDYQGCTVWNGKDDWKQASELGWRNPGYGQDEDHPVTCVNREDAERYVAWLSNITNEVYRVPSEAEWEYAARGEISRSFLWSDSRDACVFANVADKSLADRFSSHPVESCDDGFVFTSPVGSYEPNSFGIYDMTGNVWEWVQDRWHSSSDDAPSGHTPWTSGHDARGIMRGGSWANNGKDLAVTTRVPFLPSGAYSNLGFRVARDVPLQQLKPPTAN